MKGHPPHRHSRPILRVSPAPQPGNVLSEYLRENRHWLDPIHIMTWLHREHPRLMQGALLAEDLDAPRAIEALALVKARLGQQRRFRHGGVGRGNGRNGDAGKG